MDADAQAKHDKLLATRQQYIDEIVRVREQAKAGKVSASYALNVEKDLAAKIIRVNRRIGPAVV
jgi:hypothetical protein